MKDLLFQDWQDKIKDELGTTEWITVFAQDNAIKDVDQGGLYCALIPLSLKDKILATHNWDLSIGSGKPGLCSHYEDGKEITQYYRVLDEGIEPLVHWRHFPNKEGYIEISEEFRLYFDLYEDRSNKGVFKFIIFHDDGEDECIAEITTCQAKIKIKYLKKYLSVRKMICALYFDLMRFSSKSFEELKINEHDKEYKSDEYIYSLLIRHSPLSSSQIQSWLKGKKLVFPLKDYTPTIWSENSGKKYEEFIIDVDENGNEIIHSCEENNLANFFGKNEGNSFFLTPVYFKKEVLQKYYSNPQKYEVQDGSVYCKGFWHLRLDNNHPDHVMVFLGDLGRLSNKEQLHWKHHNIYAKGMSRTNFERSIEGKFSNPEAPDLFFKYRFEEFQQKWFSEFGWYLFKPLTEKDQHHYTSLYIPTTNEQKEFDEQILSLVKIFIDSLNEEKLVDGIIIEKKNAKGIDKFEAYLNYRSIKIPRMIEFLRNLQTLRSTSIAHRKSKHNKDYLKAERYFEMESKQLTEVFIDILLKTIITLNSLTNTFLSSKKEN